MKKSTLYNFLFIVIIMISIGLIPKCGDDSGSSGNSNNPPIADDNTIITDMDSQTAIKLNASDSDGDALIWNINSDPSHGSLSGTAPDLTFTPESGFFGKDTFTFYVDDGTKYSNTATVTILIKSKNIYFVNITASGTGDGSSWENAFNHPQDAVGAASAGEQVWVAKGTYYSGNNADPAVPVLQMKEEVYIYGGFDGTETSLSYRDYENNISILDGNNEAYHVVTGAVNALIDGFTITKGNANGDDFPHYYGGGMLNRDSLLISNCTFIYNSSDRDGSGMYNTYCSPTVTNCTFRFNTAIINTSKTNGGGGGIYNYHGSPNISDCTFSNNICMRGAGGANGGGGIYNNDSRAKINNCVFNSNSVEEDSGEGGGIYNWQGSPKISNCSFDNNDAYGGGAIFNYSSSAKITDCFFTDNEANYNGGGIYNSVYQTGNSPAITSCIIQGNRAGNNGGGLYNYNSSPTIFNCSISGNGGDTTSSGGGIYNYSSSPIITNCTLSGNSASYGGGLYNYLNSSPVITNCIIWGNSASSLDPEIRNVSSTPVITYTDINADGYTGSNGNIRSDPFFINGPLGNYYLSHIITGQAVNSPCIDSGSDTAENLGLIDRTTRTDSGSDTGVIDMGYHYEP